MPWAVTLIGVSALLGAVATLTESRRDPTEPLRFNAPSRGWSRLLVPLAVGAITFGSGLAHDAGHSRALYALIGLGVLFLVRACLVLGHNRRIDNGRPT